jgi:hypothetical protein
MTSCAKNSGVNNSVTLVPKASPKVMQTATPTPTIIVKEVPEPYTLSLEKFKNGDMDFGNKYLSLTMSDFKDSEYSDAALVLKTILLASEINSIRSIQSDFYKGIESISVLLNVKELEYIKTKITEFTKTLEDKSTELEKLMVLFYDKYPQAIKIENFTYTNKIDSIDIDFFKNVGYPAPKDSDVVGTIEYRKSMYFESLIKDIIIDGKLNTVNYFYTVSQLLMADVTNLSDKMMNEIIRLTEDDKYNEKRIKVQDYLEKNKGK